MIALRAVGCVKRTLGETLLVALPGARVGGGVTIVGAAGRTLAGRIAAVEASRVAITALGSVAGIAVGDRVVADDSVLRAPAGFAALGRAFDAAGSVYGVGAWAGRYVPLDAGASAPVERAPVHVPLWTGIRAIDGLLTIGRGARVGFFGAPGAGKTTLLESIVSGARADAVVVALVGERGREAQQWCERLDRRTTIVCATSDRSASERARAADAAMAQALELRGRGLDVLVIVDSLARYVAALRERRVALGEAVGRGGYPPAVWGELARYLELAGTAARGSITLLATVLSDGGDEREPLSDAARSLLDGHIVLSSALAKAGHFPAIDVLESTSRTMNNVVTAQHRDDARAVRAALAVLAASRDARSLGLAAAHDPVLAAAVAAEPALRAYLQQRDGASSRETLRSLRSLAALVAVPA